METPRGKSVVILLAALMLMRADVALAAGVDGAGVVSGCTLAGSLNFSPAFSDGNTSPEMELIAKGVGCQTMGATGDGTRLIGAKVKAKSQSPPLINGTICSSLFFQNGFSGSGFQTAIPVTVKWKVAKGSGPKLSPSTGALTNLFATAPPQKWEFEGFITGGSFAGALIDITAVFDADPSSQCAPAGVKKATFGNVTASQVMVH